MASSYTSPQDFEASYNTLFKTFATNKTKDLKWRKWQLKQCWWMMEDCEAQINEALQKDLNRHELESYAADIVGVKKDILDNIKNLEKWTADVQPDTGLLFRKVAKARMRKEPLGVTLILGAWNFPLLLIIQPMIAAIAAGCCVMLKPSDLAVHTQNVVADIVPKYLDTSAIRVVTAGPEQMPNILEHKFNHIFYTGSSKIARIISAAAAKHLTPTVLELGGQGPAIVTRNANIDLAAKRIAWAKHLNAGQICLSVNHVFCESAVYDQFVDRLKYWNAIFRNNDDKGMVKIINTRNYERLYGLLKKTAGKVIAAAGSRPEEGYFAPTIVRDVKMDDALLTEELFGPIAPVIEASIDEAITSINNLPEPLGIYIFTNSQSEVKHILDNTLSGGVTVNDCLMHAGVPGAPFGGVGESGHGSYHGVYGVDAFSHLRTVVEPPLWLEYLMGFRYPPLDIANKSKVAAKNKLGFKRGESLEDQRIGNSGQRTATSLAAAVGTLAVVIAVDKVYFNGVITGQLTA